MTFLVEIHDIEPCPTKETNPFITLMHVLNIISWANEFYYIFKVHLNT